MCKAIMHRYTKMLKSLKNHKIKKLIKHDHFIKQRKVHVYLF